jgi:hypothetical protein
MTERSPSIHSANFTSIADAAPDWLTSVVPALDQLQDGLAKVSSARADIMADLTMTEAARLVALDQLWHKHVAPAQEAASLAVEAAMLVVPANLAMERQAVFKAPQDSAGAMVASEIRQALARLGSKERTEALTKAVEAGDRTIMAAVGSAPGFLIGVPDEVVEGHRAAFIQRHCPELAKRGEACRLLIERAKQTKAALGRLRSQAFDAAEERLISEASERSRRAQRHMH